ILGLTTPVRLDNVGFKGLHGVTAAQKKLPKKNSLLKKEEMELESTQTSTTSKLLMFKQGDYEMWRLRIRTVNVEETPPKAMVAINGVSFDWSYMAKAEVPTNMTLMAFSDSETLDKLLGSQITDNSKKGLGYKSYHVVPPPPTGLFLPPKTYLSYSGLEEFQQPKFQSYGPKSCETKSKNANKEIPNELKESHDARLFKDMVSDNNDCSVESIVVVEKKIVVPTDAKIEFVKTKQQEKPVRKPVKYVEMYMSQGPRGNQRNWNNLKPNN
nr:hypothetical protein [Tanacetum cinerariifolium]